MIKGQIRSAIESLNSTGAHACHCERSLGKGCVCALKDEYVDEIMQLIDRYCIDTQIGLINRMEYDPEVDDVLVDGKTQYVAYGNQLSEKLAKLENPQ